MKTEDRKGEEKLKALARFATLCGDARREQERLLRRLLRQNADTEYGVRYRFDTIDSVRTYQERIPVTAYEDYDALIARMIAGEQNMLTAKQPVYYCISSGSMGTPKFLPVTEEDAALFQHYSMELVSDVIRKTLPEKKEKPFGKVFETLDFFDTHMQDGTMEGVRSGIAYRLMHSRGTLDTRHLTTPPEVMFAPQVEDLLYVRLRFALADREVTALHGTFVHRLTGMLRYLKRNARKLIHDVETGEVNDCFRVRDQWKRFVRARLAPDPARADELRGAFEASDRDGCLLRHIWPDLCYVRVVCGGMFRSYLDELRTYIGDLPVHHYMYAASESPFAVADTVDTDEYVLLPDTCFFEFVPAGETGASGTRPLTIAEVRPGGTYALLCTTLSGLYRYSMHDVVEVTGFRGESPVIRVCYRENQVLNLADEGMNTGQMRRGMERFSDACGVPFREYCVEGEADGALPRYRIYIEPADAGDAKTLENAEELLDRCLSECCFGYRSCREGRELARACICVLPAGTFHAYEKRLAETGKRMEQNKPVRVLVTREQKAFFAGFFAEDDSSGNRRQEENDGE